MTFLAILKCVTVSKKVCTTILLLPYLVPAKVAGTSTSEEGGAGLALVELAAGARGRQARRGDQVGRGGSL